MPRFFLTESSIDASGAVITGSDAVHIKVLRLKVGDEITLCDGQGQDYRCRITEMNDSEVHTEVLEQISDDAEPSVSCTIYAGLPKGERADYIIQKCTEAGAHAIVFFMSKRCVVRTDAKGMEKKLVRFSRIAESAAKQSGRAIIPKISFLPSLEEALTAAEQTDLPLFMYETGNRVTLRSAIEAVNPIRTAAIITGPEGGFEQFEVEFAQQHGMKPCAMGPRILRCETAPVVALTALMYATDNL